MDQGNKAVIEEYLSSILHTQRSGSYVRNFAASGNGLFEMALETETYDSQAQPGAWRLSCLEYSFSKGRGFYGIRSFQRRMGGTGR